MDDIKNGWKDAEPGSDVEAISAGIIEQYTKMFESRVSAGATEKSTGVGETSPKDSRTVLTTWKDLLKKCVERCCELANMQVEQLYEVSHPCLDDQHSNRRNWNQLENCQKFARRLS